MSIQKGNNMRKIWLDCGAWRGTSTKLFDAYQPHANEFEHYLFEPDSKVVEKYLMPFIHKGYHVINKAVFTYDGKTNFYVGKHGRGSSLCVEKETGKLDKEHPVKVETINLAKFIKQTFKSEDYIICKMNIEGVEYRVLSHLCVTYSNVLTRINKLYICWHWSKVGVDKERHDKTVDMVERNVDYVYGWNLVENEDNTVDIERNRWFLNTFTEKDI